MGARKTTLGRDAARLLGRPFVDVDEAIAAEHGPIPELFATQGEAASARWRRVSCARHLPDPSLR
jgi:shikimate kinase